MTQSAQCILNETRAIYGVGEHFVKDMNVILEKLQNDSYVNLVLHEFVSEICPFCLENTIKDNKEDLMILCINNSQIHGFAQLPKGEHSKIDVNAMKERSKTLPEYKLVDNVKILQTIFSRHLPSERFNGIINLIYATRPSATPKEIESALVTKTLEIRKFIA